MKFQFPDNNILGHLKCYLNKSFMILFIAILATQIVPCFYSISLPLEILPLEGHFSFRDTHYVAKDFGNRYHFHPVAILHPKSVSDIAKTIRHVWQMGPSSGLTVAARGSGHSLQGQSQAQHGIVVSMGSLHDHPMQVHADGAFPYVDAPGGELWINILHETLKYGLTPKSWTDYLHISVGGTLSNAGVSGQAFRHGPQISNVHQLEVVTGKGEVVNCSKKHNAELFYSVLGGLGQFGIITRARISLQPAPSKVKWIRVLYSDFTTFVQDQELLISAQRTFDYVEGFVIINRTGLVNSWRTTFEPQDPIQANQFVSEGKILYCLEMAKYFNSDQVDLADEEIKHLLSKLSYISSTHFMAEVSYIEFLDRVHTSEIKLRAKGLWEVPHPWLNLLIPKSSIHKFATQVFGNIVKDTSNGPILIYPAHRTKWDNRTSVVIPEEDIFYLVAFLSSAVPTSTGTNSVDHILTQNQRILNVCESTNLKVKQYLPHYSTQEEWKAHFGQRWKVFKQRKATYPMAILAPGQRIFQKSMPPL